MKKSGCWTFAFLMLYVSAASAQTPLCSINQVASGANVALALGPIPAAWWMSCAPDRPFCVVACGGVYCRFADWRTCQRTSSWLGGICVSRDEIQYQNPHEALCVILNQLHRGHERIDEEARK